MLILLGTATGGVTDYDDLTANTVTFGPGAIGGHCDVIITQDELPETDETFTLVISNGTAAVGSVTTATVTIIDDGGE